MNPPAKVTTRGSGGASINFPGGASVSTPEIVCEFLISETVAAGSSSCGGFIEEKWVGDPTNPLWFGSDPIYAGDASGGANASCVSGLPANPCDADPSHVFAGAGFTLTYYYDNDYPPNYIPVAGSPALALLPLAAGAIAVRRRMSDACRQLQS